MPESFRNRLIRWAVEEVLHAYPGMRIAPSIDGEMKLQGSLAFAAKPSSKERIDDAYEISIAVPEGFPGSLPSVCEIGGRIPPTYHKLDDGSLCLGSPTRLMLMLSAAPTLKGYIDHCIVPYLYGYSYFERCGVPPFGELDHGRAGIVDDFALLFGAKSSNDVPAFLRLTAMSRRVANKKPCPCGSPHRLGRCHHVRVNELRRRLGRGWFRTWQTVLSPKVEPAIAAADSKDRPTLDLGQKSSWSP